jgi:hypothetical protein
MPQNFGLHSTAPHREHYLRRKACRRMSVDFLNNLMSGGGGGMLGNPVTRTAIVDIVAMAAKKMMGR